MPGRIRFTLAAAMLGLLGSVLPMRSHAGPHPRSGTFQGVYHLDRFGEGWFLDYVVPKELRDRFEMHEGRRIRVEVLRAHQEFIPGPGFLDEVGTITEVLDGPDLRLEVERRRLGRDVHVAVRITNRGDEAVVLEPRQLSVTVRSRTTGTRHIARQGYGRSAMVSYDGYRMLGSIRVEGAGTCTLPFAPVRADVAGEHELEATYRHPGVECRYQAWHAYDVPGTATSESDPRLRVAARSIEVVPGRRQTGSAARIYRLHLRMGCAPGPAVPILRQEAEPGEAHCVRLRAWTRSGKEVELCDHVLFPNDRTLWNIERHRATGRYVALPPDGSELECLAVHHRTFPVGRIHAWSLDVLTPEGLERIRFGEGFEDPLFVDPPRLSREQCGIRVRVRPYRNRYAKSGEHWFVLQAVNETGMPLTLLRPGPLEASFLACVDGEPVPIREESTGFFGWAAPHVCATPMERLFKLPSDLVLKPGEHTIAVGLRGEGGTHPNASAKPVPILAGTVWTDDTPFVVE